VNTAGVPWANVQALRRRGVDARLVVFNRYALHPEADWSLERPDGFLRAQAVQWRALAALLPRTDVFHFYFGLSLVPKSLQFPILRALRKKSVFHYLGSDIRGKTPAELAFGKRANAEIVGSYDAIRWVPEAEVVPPGIDLSRYKPVTVSDTVHGVVDPAGVGSAQLASQNRHGPVTVSDTGSRRPVIVHAPSSRRRKGTEHVVAACEGLDAELDVVEGLHHDEAMERYRRADIVVDQLNAGWYGLFAIEAMALGKPVLAFLHNEAVRRTEEALGVRVPVVGVTRETLRARLEELVADPELRRRVGAEGRAYVERVHDVERIADRLLDIYARL
jgi:glycosyltransferase involved in cell wall biosynthesis